MKEQTIVNARRMGLNLIIGLFVLVAIVSVVANVSAFAISAPYMQDKKMYVLPGQSEEITFVLQNEVADGESITITPTITSGSEIFSITDENEEYTVPAGGMVNVNAIVNVPADADPDEMKQVVISFLGSKQGGAGFGFGMDIKQSFFVVSGDSPQMKAQKALNFKALIVNVTQWIILTALVAIVSYFVFFRKKQTRDEKDDEQDTE